jgi:thiamine-monophosphate kinase
MAGEFERIAEIRRRLASASADIELGIGDDAALLRASPRAQALSVDTQVEGVHFSRAYSSLADIGYRALAAAVSDLGAMGARPRAALSAWIVPETCADAELYAIADGIAEAARDFGCPVAGGNLAAGRELSITTTVIGDAPERALTRAGARPGHTLFVTGALGASALGLAALQAGRADLAPDCVARYRRPRARVCEGLALVGIASAAIDVSDGLLQDLDHLATASGVGFEIELAQLPLHPELVAGCRALGCEAEALALTGGEDYELLFTAAQDSAPPTLPASAMPCRIRASACAPRTAAWHPPRAAPDSSIFGPIAAEFGATRG